MIQISKQSDLIKTTEKIPVEVYCEISKVLDILDAAYGAERDIIKDLGGYILLLESAEDFNALTEVNIDPTSAIADYIDTIDTTGTGKWLNVLILLGGDYAVSLFFPKVIAPENFLGQID